MSVTGICFGTRSRTAFLATVAVVLALSLTSPVRANVDVTLDISGASGGPTISQGPPQTPARTGFDPLPLGGMAMLLIALGSMALAKQTRTSRDREGTS